MNKNIIKWGMSVLAMGLLVACGGQHATGLSSSSEHGTGLSSSSESSSHATGLSSSSESSSHATGISSSSESSSHATGISSSESEESSESKEVEGGFVVTINGEISNIAVVTEDIGTDHGFFEVTLAADDLVRVSYDDEDLSFYGYNGVAYEEATVAFTAEVSGLHKFYINSSDEIWVLGKSDEPVGTVNVDLWTKFSISDDQVNLAAYAWVWSEGGEGAWFSATHVTESWESEFNRHYTITLEGNPTGKKVKLAVFSEESGVTPASAPTGWEGAVAQSGDATIEDWTTSYGANLYA